MEAQGDGITFVKATVHFGRLSLLICLALALFSKHSDLASKESCSAMVNFAQLHGYCDVSNYTISVLS